MESVNDVKNVLHSSYEHALRTDDLLVFSATYYEKMLGDIDALLDNLVALDKDSAESFKSQETVNPVKKEIADQKVRDALGLDRVDTEPSSQDVMNKKGSDSDNATSSQDSESVSDVSEKRSDTSKLDDTSEGDSKVASENVSQTPNISEDSSVNAAVDVKDKESKPSAESESEDLENDESSTFDAGALLNSEHDKLVEKNKTAYKADDFLKSNDSEIQTTAKTTVKSENVDESNAEQTPLFK